MTVFFEYSYRNTFYHRLHPVTKLVMTFNLFILAGLYWDVRFLLPIAVIGLIISYNAKVPLRWFLAIVGVMIFLIPFTLIGMLTQVNPLLFKVYPKELVSQEFFSVTLPIIGKIGLTWGGLLWGLAFELRIPIILLIIYPFIYSTSFNDLVNALARYNIPYQLLFVLMVAYRFVPVTVRETMTIITALRLRGWEVRSRNPQVVFRRFLPLAFSLVRTLVKMIDEVNTAAKIRAFGTSKFTPVRQVKMRPLDKTLTAVSIVLFAAALYMLFT
ncbi:MAG: energy-coupling factor transporter transmembrane protein EcfT, partial [Candidatus Caldarchaeum sp.]|nr:energy-coupling factor transporter transmembrane protein EcfT [Candidatus Caldarchaeum sp.]MDW8435990.1 energy-coupling factor transporter transmembrane component T [Candidatus Caldarchaeum sp.]